MSVRTATTLLCSTFLASCVSTARHTDADTGVVGSWKLVSVVATTPDGRRNEAPYGANPAGELHYSADGRVMLMLSYGGRPKLSIADRVAAPAAERAEAFATHFGYAGRYEVSGGRMTHHIEVASYENWVGTDLVRELTVQGRRLTLRTPPVVVNGGTQTNELTWERLD